MSKYKVTVLSPLHIATGEKLEINYNFVKKDNFIYLFDEFKLADFFVSHDIEIPYDLDAFKDLVEKYSDDLVASGLYSRKIENTFGDDLEKLLVNISTSNMPIVSGSSIKGSLRTAILDGFVNYPDEQKTLTSGFKNKVFDAQRLSNGLNDDLAELFKYLKISDSSTLLNTKIYKVINIKKQRSHQSNRGEKVEKIAEYVEAIMPGQVFEIVINDFHDERVFKEIGSACNMFYKPFMSEDARYYFSKDGLDNEFNNLSNELFIVNVGKYGGAERKSINNLRKLKAIRYGDKSKTTARSFALESEYKDVYFEKRLLPFGWLKFENKEKKSFVEGSEENKILGSSTTKVIKKVEVQNDAIVKKVSEWSMQDIAKVIGVSVDEVIQFALNSRMPLKKLTSNTILKEPQAKGIINKMKKLDVKNQNIHDN